MSQSNQILGVELRYLQNSAGLFPVNAVSTGADSQNVVQRLGLKPGMIIQELGWDEDVDDTFRAQLEDVIDSDLVDGEYGDVVDAVLLWWRAEDGDLVDGLVDALTDLAKGGAIWLLTPKVGRANSLEAADIAEAAPIAGLSTTSTISVSADWAATKLVTPKS